MSVLVPRRLCSLVSVAPNTLKRRSQEAELAQMDRMRRARRMILVSDAYTAMTPLLGASYGTNVGVCIGQIHRPMDWPVAANEPVAGPSTTLRRVFERSDEDEDVTREVSPDANIGTSATREATPLLYDNSWKTYHDLEDYDIEGRFITSPTGGLEYPTAAEDDSDKENQEPIASGSGTAYPMDSDTANALYQMSDHEVREIRIREEKEREHLSLIRDLIMADGSIVQAPNEDDSDSESDPNDLPIPGVSE